MSSRSFGSKGKVTVVGGGLAGALMACVMAQRGYTVALYEMRGDIRDVKSQFSGRSINLALSERGRSALRLVGLEDKVVQTTIPMRARYMHGRNGEVTKQPYGTHGEAILSVDRRLLNQILLDKAEEMGIEINFHHALRSIYWGGNEVTFEVRQSWKDEPRVVKVTDPGLIVGADGAFSVVRRNMMRRPGFNFSQTYIDHAYKELYMPPAEGGGFRMPTNYLHIWPRETFMVIALPNQDCSFTVTCFFPASTFDELGSDDDKITAFFEQHFPDLLELIPNLVENYKENPAGALVTVRCSPYNLGDRAVIVGDAAHAMVPFYGQGMNASLEDCRVLNALLDEFNDDHKRALDAFTKRRQPDGLAICDLALYNYVEMRAHTASRLFLLQKKLEAWLHYLLPKYWIPLYTRVSFTTEPYAEVVKNSEFQDRMLGYGKQILVGGLAAVAAKTLGARLKARM